MEPCLWKFITDSTCNREGYFKILAPFLVSLGFSSTQEKLGQGLILEVGVEAVTDLDRRLGFINALGSLECIHLDLGRAHPARAKLLA